MQSSDLHRTSPSPPEQQSLAYYAEQLADERKKAMQRFEDYQRATAAWREEMAAAGEPVEDVDDDLAAPSSCLVAGADDHVAAASFPWLEVTAVLFLLLVNCPAMRRRLLRLLKRGSEPDGVWHWLSRPSAASARAAPPSALKPPVDHDAGQTDNWISRWVSKPAVAMAFSCCFCRGTSDESGPHMRPSLLTFSLVCAAGGGMQVMELVGDTTEWFDDGRGYVKCKREGMERLPDGLPMETYRRRRESGRGYLDKTWAYVLDKCKEDWGGAAACGGAAAHVGCCEGVIGGAAAGGAAASLMMMVVVMALLPPSLLLLCDRRRRGGRRRAVPAHLRLHDRTARAAQHAPRPWWYEESAPALGGHEREAVEVAGAAQGPHCPLCAARR